MKKPTYRKPRAKRQKRVKSFPGQMDMNFDSIVGSISDFTAADIDTSDVTDMVHASSLTPDQESTDTEFSVLAERMISRLASIDSDIGEISILLSGWYSNTSHQMTKTNDVMSSIAVHLTKTNDVMSSIAVHLTNTNDVMSSIDVHSAKMDENINDVSILLSTWFNLWVAETQREEQSDKDNSDIEKKENDIAEDGIKEDKKVDLREQENQNESERVVPSKTPQTTSASGTKPNSSDTSSPEGFSTSSLVLGALLATAIASMMPFIAFKIGEFISESVMDAMDSGVFKDIGEFAPVKFLGEVLTGVSESGLQAALNKETTDFNKRMDSRGRIKKEDVDSPAEAEQYNKYYSLVPGDVKYIDPSQFKNTMTPTASPDIPSKEVADNNEFSRAADIGAKSPTINIGSVGSQTTNVASTGGGGGSPPPTMIRSPRNATPTIRRMEENSLTA